MKNTLKNNAARAVFAVAATACLLTGCVTTVPSSQSDENDLSGSYKVVDQSRRQSLQAESAEIKFFRSAPDVGGGISAGYLKLTGPSVPDGWAFPACGYPGDGVRSGFSGNADPANIEIIRCTNPQDLRSMPVIFLIKTKDGSAFHYSSGILDPFNKSLEVSTGRLLVINWWPDSQSAYVLKAN
ncbi:hypothetical protein PQR14_03465 [Paraburkholderia bryophila]|uniref:hypothetical protein n=1 Tax=Burkholderiaceae TaxID=119060 RepID=UPI000555A2E9|nr:hypothetical protein [Burkholderia sp. 9120]